MVFNSLWHFLELKEETGAPNPPLFRGSGGHREQRAPRSEWHGCPRPLPAHTDLSWLLTFLAAILDLPSEWPLLDGSASSLGTCHTCGVEFVYAPALGRELTRRWWVPQHPFLVWTFPTCLESPGRAWPWAGGEGM